jgi:hypothetical protein
MVKVACCELVKKVIIERKSTTLLAKENFTTCTKYANKREEQIQCLGNSGTTNITNKILSLS